MSITTIQLSSGEELPLMLRQIGHQQPATTPAEWFARRYPAEVKRWGCPFLEAVETELETGKKRITALSLNDCFFAAILSDSQLGHSVIFFNPEQQWYFLDPTDNIYYRTSEAKLMNLLSSLLTRCAEEMPPTIDKVSLFMKFRADETLRAVVKRARSILAADASFFSLHSPHYRFDGTEQHGQLAKQFVGLLVKPSDGQMLSIAQCYERFCDYCRQQNLKPMLRRKFAEMLVEMIRDEFGLGLRKDLKDSEGHYLRGWKGLTLEMEAAN